MQVPFVSYNDNDPKCTLTLTHDKHSWLLCLFLLIWGVVFLMTIDVKY